MEFKDPFEKFEWTILKIAGTIMFTTFVSVEVVHWIAFLFRQ